MSTRTQQAPPLPVKHLLESYTTSHPLRSPSPLPPSSRVDPSLAQKQAPPSSSSPLLWTLPTWIVFARFATLKGLFLLLSLLRHVLFGPARKSWGYRMTFITSFMRNVADHTNLADIVLVRRLISLHHLVPLPADAIVTPVTFTVPKRSEKDAARGFLRYVDLSDTSDDSELDLKETGKRELSGEWVVGKEVWARLKSERRERMDKERRRARQRKMGVTFPDEVESSEGEKEAVPERVIYYVHGGAYYVGNAATHRLITIGVSKACDARVFAITYRLAPEHAFPLPLHDVLHGYLRLLSPPLNIPASNIVIAGDSAGGGLSLALCMYLRDEGYQMPSGLILMSPWVDLTMSCGSWEENAHLDVVPRPEKDDHLNPVGCYLGPEGIKTFVTHPYASPLFGHLDNLPPMLIQSGDSEVLRDEITLLAHKATLAGAVVTHELYEDMVHVFQMFTFLPAAEAAIASVGRFVRTTLPRLEAQGRGLPGKLASDVVNNVGEELEAEGARVVRGDGEAVGVGLGEVEALPDEVKASRISPRRPRKEEVPDLDTDSLEASGSRTPPRPAPETVITPSKPMAPRLRRAFTALSPSKSISMSANPISRRRAPSSASAHVSPAVSPMAANKSLPPTPSGQRRRPRAPTISSKPPALPTTRARSRSHSDILQLVEGYGKGAANQTVVISPGGETVQGAEQTLGLELMEEE